MAAHADAFRQAGGAVRVVTQARPGALPGFVQRTGCPFPVLADPERQAYRSFGLERASWWELLRPAVLTLYARLLWRGGRLRRPSAGEDVRQLGGDFVLDGQRRLVYAFRSGDPSQRPSATELLEAVRRAAGTPYPDGNR